MATVALRYLEWCWDPDPADMTYTARAEPG